MRIRSIYENRVLQRSAFHFFIGIFPRLFKFILFSLNCSIARAKGAKIGTNAIIPFSLAKKANKNLTIGNNVSIDTNMIDLRIPIWIGDNVIIGSNVEIITSSHNIDSQEWEYKPYGLIIEDFVWIASKALILPSCKFIKRGGVIGAGSVVAKNVDEMSVVVGNVAYHLRFRKCIHSDVVVESLRGGDFLKYIQVRIIKKIDK
jgi:maltose O-acetyltransferase